MGRASRGVAVAWLAISALSTRAPAQDSVAPPPPSLPPPARRTASVVLRPLASLLVPGAGQLLARQDRGAVYLAAEVYLVSRFIQLDHEADREARRFQALADFSRP